MTRRWTRALRRAGVRQAAAGMVAREQSRLAYWRSDAAHWAAKWRTRKRKRFSPLAQLSIRYARRILTRLAALPPYPLP